MHKLSVAYVSSDYGYLPLVILDQYLSDSLLDVPTGKIIKSKSEELLGFTKKQGPVEIVSVCRNIIKTKTVNTNPTPTPSSFVYIQIPRADT